MFRQGKTYILILIFLTIWSGNICSQTTSSPYSIFGVGYLESNSMGPSKGMGGTGIAFLSDIAINPMNPASYSGIDSLVSIFEVGIFGKYTSFATKTDNQSVVNANLKYVVMGFRINPWLATSFGFLPYSSVGYTINAKTPIEGTALSYIETFSGSGGVNQVYLGGSVKIFKNLSVGINAAYLFGNITRSESSDDFGYYLKDITYISNFDVNYGLNYRFNINKWRYNLGFIYGRARDLRTESETTIQTGTGTETVSGQTYGYSIPQNAGAGFSLRKGFFRLGIDYEWSNWQDVEFTNVYFKTRNSNRISVGFELPSMGVRKGTNKMIFFRFGGEYRQSYLLINNYPVDCRLLTFGAGLPLKGSLSTINVSLEVGQVGTTSNGLIQESFVSLHLDMSLRDLWFMKKRFN
jgi:hypothetical protein